MYKSTHICIHTNIQVEMQHICKHEITSTYIHGCTHIFHSFLSLLFFVFSVSVLVVILMNSILAWNSIVECWNDTDVDTFLFLCSIQLHWFISGTWWQMAWICHYCKIKIHSSVWKIHQNILLSLLLMKEYCRKLIFKCNFKGSI